MASDYSKVLAKQKKYLEQGGNDPKVLVAFKHNLDYANTIDIESIQEGQKVIDKL